jgi:hypothetical protein
MSADVHVEVSRARGFGVISSKITSSELTRLKRSRFGNKNFLSSFVEYYLKKSQNMKKSICGEACWRRARIERTMKNKKTGPARFQLSTGFWRKPKWVL